MQGSLFLPNLEHIPTFFFLGTGPYAQRLSASRPGYIVANGYQVSGDVGSQADWQVFLYPLANTFAVEVLLLVEAEDS